MKVDKSVALAALIRRLGGGKGSNVALRIVTVKTAVPYPITLVFEGTKIALDLDIFDVPITCYPLQKGDKFYTAPLAGGGAAPRWAIITKINQAQVLGNTTGSSTAYPTGFTLDGSGYVYPITDLIAPASLKGGARIAVSPVWDAGANKVKYVVLTTL